MQKKTKLVKDHAKWYVYASDEPKPSWLELKVFQLGSARDLFYFSSDLKIDQKRAENFCIINLFWKWLNYVLLCYINSNKWLWNWLNSWYISKNLKRMLLNNVHCTLKNLLPNNVYIVSSVSARKLKCPSSARLGLSWKIPARAHH